ncbi:hypothetical protein SPSYN_02916 [Sporotomaculum syntrophicum]|uniref:Uncharacterized protein n=1 Tax=Sporotomaculum syntrophicum TaxID=182264 RepID=A0A9D2WMP1_9FIRM|nr:hypothetical protein SPSYN_02916 [Sporotomaculum syntrophicum]
MLFVFYMDFFSGLEPSPCVSDDRYRGIKGGDYYSFLRVNPIQFKPYNVLATY